MSGMPDWWLAGCMGGKQECRNAKREGRMIIIFTEFEVHEKYTFHAIYLDPHHRTRYAE
jgi:hypothetical protein